MSSQKTPPPDPSDDDFDDDDDGDGELEMLDVTESYLAEIDKTFQQNVGAVEMIGGNILVHIFGVATRMIVSSGPTKGLYDDATDDPVHFTFAVPQWVLLQLLDPDPARPFDLEAAKKDGTVLIEGDPGIYQRFMKLGRTKKSPLSIRFS